MTRSRLGGLGFVLVGVVVDVVEAVVVLLVGGGAVVVVVGASVVVVVLAGGASQGVPFTPAAGKKLKLTAFMQT